MLPSIKIIAFFFILENIKPSIVRRPYRGLNNYYNIAGYLSFAFPTRWRRWIGGLGEV